MWCLKGIPHEFSTAKPLVICGTWPGFPSPPLQSCFGVRRSSRNLIIWGMSSFLSFLRVPCLPLFRTDFRSPSVQLPVIRSIPFQGFTCWRDREWLSENEPEGDSFEGHHSCWFVFFFGSFHVSFRAYRTLARVQLCLRSACT